MDNISACNVIFPLLVSTKIIMARGACFRLKDKFEVSSVHILRLTVAWDKLTLLFKVKFNNVSFSSFTPFVTSIRQHGL